MHTMLQMHRRLIFISIIANFSVKNINASAEVIGRRAGLQGHVAPAKSVHHSIWKMNGVLRTSLALVSDERTVRDPQCPRRERRWWTELCLVTCCKWTRLHWPLLSCTLAYMHIHIDQIIFYSHKKMCMHPTQGYMADLEWSAPRGTLLSMWWELSTIYSI